MRPRTPIGWAAAICTALVALGGLACLLLLLAQMAVIVDFSGVSEEVAARSDVYQALARPAIALGLALVALAGATALVLLRASRAAARRA